MTDILIFIETQLIDETIEEYEYHECDPITGSNLNNGGDIRIKDESQDVLTHPSESYLIFEGRLTKADGTACTNGEVALTNNATMHHFSRIKYKLSNQLIASLSYPGQVSIMIGVPKYPDDFQRLRASMGCGIKTQQHLQLKLIIMDLLPGMHISSSHQPS